tara:strand:+ start:935 stop:1687 length:753 start_codon:yes stop_codon:yes gene_type:complete
MAIDLDALRKKHEQLSNPGGTAQNADFLNKFFQLKEGTNTLRILPWKDDEKEFYAETKIHRVTDSQGNVKNHHCRKVHGEACPLCDLYYGLWKTGKKEDEDLARQIKPRARYYMNAVDRETGTVKILSIGVILFKKIIGAMLDEDFGDITDLENGHDFKIIKTMEGQWPKYDQSQPRPKSEAAGSKAEIAEWTDTLHDVHALVPLEEYDECKRVAESLAVGSPPSPISDQATEENQGSQSGDDYLSRLRS